MTTGSIRQPRNRVFATVDLDPLAMGAKEFGEGNLARGAWQGEFGEGNLASIYGW